MFDAAFLCALRDRNAEAEEQLISHFSAAVRSKLRARLRSPSMVEDAFQETFLRVFAYFRANKTLDNPASLGGFMHSVCHNVALEVLRANTRQDQFPNDFTEPRDSRPDPEGQSSARERAEMLRKHIAELPARDRELLSRVFLDEEDKDEVCRDLCVGRDHLRILLHRARVRLKVTLAALSKDSLQEKGEIPKRRTASTH